MDMKEEKGKKDSITKSFGDLIREYQRAAHPTRESIEMAYSNEYKIKTKKMKKNKKDNMDSETCE